MDNFNEEMRRQIEQFNRQVKDAVRLHSHTLKKRYADRIKKDFKEPYDPAVRMHVIRPRRFGNSMLQQAGRLCEAGRRIDNRIIPTRQKPTQSATDPPDVIEGKFTVLGDAKREGNTSSKTNKEEN